MDDTKPDWALIIAGGNPVKPETVARLQKPAWVVAADSGLDQALRLGITPNLVIGDMDSVSASALKWAEAEKVSIERYPTDKDATDLELAIDAAERAGYTKATIIGGTGGRMAHTLANAMLLLPERSIDLDWQMSRAIITAIRPGESREYNRDHGALLSVLPIGGPAECSSEGLRWPLDGSTLVAGSSRGVSNEIALAAARVEVLSGKVLTVHERN